MQIHPAGPSFSMRTGGQTDTTNLIGEFRNFANTSKKTATFERVKRKRKWKFPLVNLFCTLYNKNTYLEYRIVTIQNFNTLHKMA